MKNARNSATFASTLLLGAILSTTAFGQVYYNSGAGHTVYPTQTNGHVQGAYGYGYQTETYPNQWPPNQYSTYPNQTSQYPANASTSSQTQPAQSRAVASSNIPNYVQPIIEDSRTGYHQGERYDSWAGAGLDQRTEKSLGGTYDARGGFVGGRINSGAGFYGDTGVSQSGRVGNVDVRNYAEGSTFVGAEAGAQAGLNGQGVTAGANGFVGGRMGGTVGSDIGPIGYGATAEAWSGAGGEIGVNAGINDGVLTFGGEAGLGLGVGGKLGVQGSVDVGAIGDGIQSAGQDAGRWGQQAGRDAGQWTKKATRNAGNWTKKAGKNVGKSAKGVGNKIKGIFGK